jgi:hypothetical protein
MSFGLPPFTGGIGASFKILEIPMYAVGFKLDFYLFDAKGNVIDIIPHSFRSRNSIMDLSATRATLKRYQ